MFIISLVITVQLTYIVIQMAPQELSQLCAIRVCLITACSIFLGDMVLAEMLRVIWFVSSVSSLSAVLPYGLGSACSSAQPAKLLGFLGTCVGPCILVWVMTQVTGHGCKTSDSSYHWHKEISFTALWVWLLISEAGIIIITCDSIVLNMFYWKSCLVFDPCLLKWTACSAERGW